ncbi:MarR family winged helix-turn-helix transcriptional regulator [Algihabitans albus]|uniref:MarR family winged helix-turn-helix transcriptional regulator n=1 Tax=Algihabitans albus TaxID=2164067 RepID=UPI000E5CFA71|nr:MarR family transcriptional regulator [Algihabitans albus]
MSDERTANLLGALALALTDTLADVTSAQAERGAGAPAALVLVSFYPGQSIDSLAQTLGLSHSATVRLADRLAGDGLLDRRSGADGRTTALHLTRKGQARANAILGERCRALSAALDPLSVKERAHFTRSLEKILGGLTRDRQHADHICRLCDERVCPADGCPVECAAVERSAAEGRPD